MFSFAFAVLVEVSVSLASVPPIDEVLPQGALVRIGGTRFNHFEPISWVGFSPDGKAVITAGSKNRLRFWDPTSGVQKAEVPCGPVFRSNFAFSADGKRLVVADYGSDVLSIFDADSRKHLGQLSYDDVFGPREERAFRYHSFLLSADGQFLVTWDRPYMAADVNRERPATSVRVWNLRVNRRIAEWQTGDLYGAELSQNGRTFVAQERNAGESKLRSWDLVTGREVASAKLPRALSTFMFLPDGKTFIGRTEKHDALHRYDTATGKELGVIVDQGGPIDTFAVSADGERLAMAQPGRLVVLRLSDGATIADLPPLRHARNQVVVYPWYTLADRVAFSPDGWTLAVADSRSLELWDLKTLKRKHSESAMSGPVLAVHTHGQHLLTRDGDMNVTLWDLPTGQMPRRFVGQPGARRDETLVYWRGWDAVHRASGLQAISPDGQKIAAVWLDGPVQIFDLASGRRLHALKGSEKATCLAFSANSKYVAAPASDGPISLWDATTGKLVQNIPLPQENDPANQTTIVVALHFPTGGRTLAASALSSRIAHDLLLWELGTGQPRLPFDKEKRQDHGAQSDIDKQAEKSTLAFRSSPDGKLIALAAHNGIRLLDTVTGKEIRRFGGRDVVGQSAAFSPDGKYLGAGLESGGIRFWDLASGAVLRDAPAHKMTVTSLTFADANTLVSGSLDGTAIAWDVRRLLKGGPVDAIDFDRLWTTLGHSDAEKAAKAMQPFAVRPKQTIAYFQDHVRPIAIVDPKRIGQLVADLQSGQYPARQRATEELEKLSGQARSALEKALPDVPAVETRRRIESLLQKLEPPITSPELLRGIRAIEVAERIGGSEARAFLEKLAAGGPGHRVTEDARDALVRLRRSQMGK